MLSRCLMTFNAEPSIVPSRRSSDPQRAAARAASAAAALAYMHPDLIDANQLKHLYAPVVYTALAFELD